MKSDTWQAVCWRCTKIFEVSEFKHFCPDCAEAVETEKQKRIQSEEADRIRREQERIERERLRTIEQEQRRAAAAKLDSDQKKQWIEANLPPGFRRSLGLPNGVDATGHLAAVQWFDSLTKQKAPNLHLYVHGESGIGKTWTCNAITLAAAHKRKGIELRDNWIVRTDGIELQREIPSRVMSNDQGALDELLDPMRRAWILIIDELDKMTGSERVTSEFFSLLNERIEHEQTTILASFAEPADIIHLFNRRNEKQLGVQIVRRVVDFFTIIHMRKGQP